jgi:hypothetical protein
MGRLRGENILKKITTPEINAEGEKLGQNICAIANKE